MKKILLSLLIACSMMLSSCDVTAQMAYDGLATSFEYYYYDYGNHYPIFYMNSIPYYRLWIDNAWAYRLVPYNRMNYIRHFDTPHRFEPRMGGFPMNQGRRNEGQPRMSNFGGAMRGGNTTQSQSRMSNFGNQMRSNPNINQSARSFGGGNQVRGGRR